jgi:hypothetical protein
MESDARLELSGMSRRNAWKDGFKEEGLGDLEVHRLEEVGQIKFLVITGPTWRRAYTDCMILF